MGREVVWRDGCLLRWQGCLALLEVEKDRIKVFWDLLSKQMTCFFSDRVLGTRLLLLLLPVVQSVFESYNMYAEDVASRVASIQQGKESAFIQHEGFASFLITACIRALRQSKRFVNVGTEDIDLNLLVPEATFDFTETIPESALSAKKFLGKGGFGEVFGATYKGKEVAVKYVLLGDDDANAKYRELAHEVALMA